VTSTAIITKDYILTIPTMEKLHKYHKMNLQSEVAC